MRVVSCAAWLLVTGASAGPRRDAIAIPTYPSFGCLGWSPRDKVIACIVGSHVTRSLTDISLDFEALHGGDAPDSVALRSIEYGSVSDLTDAERDAIAAQLRGYVPVDRRAHVVVEYEYARELARRGQITADYQQRHSRLAASPPVQVAGTTLSVHVTPHDPGYQVELAIKGGVGPRDRTVLEMIDDTVSHVDAYLYVLDGVAIVECTSHADDEGESRTRGSVFICTRTGCTEH
jgi:hypothetical protein